VFVLKVFLFIFLTNSSTCFLTGGLSVGVAKSADLISVKVLDSTGSGSLTTIIDVNTTENLLLLQDYFNPRLFPNRG
jgi:subtilisin family serine protease